MNIKISRLDWENIGRTAGWMDYSDDYGRNDAMRDKFKDETVGWSERLRRDMIDRKKSEITREWEERIYSAYPEVSGGGILSCLEVLSRDGVGVEFDDHITDKILARIESDKSSGGLDMSSLEAYFDGIVDELAEMEVEESGVDFSEKVREEWSESKDVENTLREHMGRI